MRKPIAAFLYTVVAMILFPSMAFFALADGKKPQLPPPVTAYIKSVAKDASVPIYSIDKVCTQGACPGAPPVVPVRRRPPRPPYYVVSISRLPYDFRIYGLEAAHVFAKNAFQGSAILLTSTITLDLSALKQSTRNELNAGTVMVSEVIGHKSLSDVIYLFLTIKK
jgi:hypothetical protein